MAFPKHLAIAERELTAAWEAGATFADARRDDPRAEMAEAAARSRTAVVQPARSPPRSTTRRPMRR